MTEKLRSLAHPEWPYAGTAHEWRGFVQNENAPKAMKVRLRTVVYNTDGHRVGYVYQKAAEYASDQVFDGIRPISEERVEMLKAVYQKQNFGPDLK